MTDHDDINEIIEIDFEVGHTSIIRPEPTTNHKPPRTHDWKVYLRAADIHGDLTRLIKRCVFHLHPDFPDHKRELKSTPFAIQETGYAGFPLGIDIFFNTKKEPKKHRIEYDLDLHTNVDGGPFRQRERYRRTYRYTFYNPDPEFREKILAAGGKSKDLHSGSSKQNESDESEVGDDETDEQIPEPTVRLMSPPGIKRPFSPAPAANTSAAKKIKIESVATSQKKKQQSQASVKNENATKITITTGNSKKQPSQTSNKPSPITEEKSNKNPPMKELNHTVTSNSFTNETPDDSLSKPRSSVKVKTDQDVKSSSAVSTKRKKPVASPSKLNMSNTTKKATTIPVNKPAQRLSIKTETISISNKSPSNVPTKQEASPNTTSSNSTNTTVLISSLKKIPKKVIPPPPPPPINEKRARSPMSPLSSNRNSDRASHRYSSTSSKNSKMDRSTTNSTQSSSSSTINSSSSSRASSSTIQSGKHSTINGSGRGRSHSRSRSRSHSRSRSSHQTHHSSRSHHSSRHSSQQKDRSSRYSSPPSSHHGSSSSKNSSSHRNKNHRRRTPSRSTQSPSRSIPSTIDPINSSSNEPMTVSSSINTPQSRPNSVEPAIVVSTTCSPSAHVFQSEDDHTQTPMDIDGQTDDDDTNARRIIPNADENYQPSPPSSNFISHSSITQRNSNRLFQSDHSNSLSDTNESIIDSDLSLDEDDELPVVLTDGDLRLKLIYIYKRFTSNSMSDLKMFANFLKRHHLIDTSTLSTSKSNDGTFTFDLFSLNPLLIGELANDLGYHSNNNINQN